MPLRKTEVTSQITISCADGEDLYVHPYSVLENWWSPKHRVRWLKPEEFEPYPSRMQDYLWDTSGNYGCHIWRRFRRWFWMGTGRWAASAAHHFAYHSRWVWRNPPWRRPRDWRDWWLGWIDPSLMYPVLCLELYPGVLNLTGQLQVSDPEDLSETYYLTPTDKYINRRFGEVSRSYLDRACGEGSPLSDWEQGRLFDLGSFLVWRTKQEALKREVHYLVSLDT
jgi:hypothetical protein